MRILLVVPVYSASLGGTVAVVRSIARELSRRNQVTVCTTSAADQNHDLRRKPYEVESDGHRTVYFPRNLKRSGLNISLSMATFLCRNFDYDVVHVHSWRQFQDPLVFALGRLFDVPYLVQIHGSIPRILTRRFAKLVYDSTLGRKVLDSSRYVVASSELEAHQYQTLGVPRTKIAVIPNGMDIKQYQELTSNLGDIRGRLGIGKHEKLVLYVGRIHESKGLGLLAEAFAAVVKEVPESRLVLIGPDDGYQKRLERVITQLGIRNQVTFTGFVSKKEKMAALAEAHVFVTPTYHAFPITFLEACFSRCPIVTTSSELSWIDNNVGFVTGMRPQDVANAVIRILTDHLTQEKLKANCESTIQRFSMDVVGAQLESLYRRAMR